MPKVNILQDSRTNTVTAFIEGQEGRACLGASLEEAIGFLVLQDPTQFGIWKIDYTDRPAIHEPEERKLWQAPTPQEVYAEVNGAEKNGVKNRQGMKVRGHR